jgi:hypothetical protein
MAAMPLREKYGKRAGKLAPRLPPEKELRRETPAFPCGQIGGQIKSKWSL